MYDNYVMEQMLPLLITVIVLYGVLLIGGLVGYILRSVGIMQLSSTLGLSNGWLGFIPIARDYQAGKMAGDIELGNKKISNPGIWMMVLPLIAYGAFYAVYFSYYFSFLTKMTGMVSRSSLLYDEEEILSMVLGMFGQMLWVLIIMYIVLYVASIFIALIRYMALNRVFCYFYEGQRPVFYLLLSAFVPFAEAILMIKTAKRPVICPPPYPNQNMYFSQPYGQYPPYPNGPQAQYPPYQQQPYDQQPPYGQQSPQGLPFNPPPQPPYQNPVNAPSQPYPGGPDESRNDGES